MKQRIADGVAEWLRTSAPVEIWVRMDRKQFDDLVQTICDQFTEADVEQVEE